MSYGRGYFAYSIFMLTFLTAMLVNHLAYAAKLTNFALCFAFMWCHLAFKEVSAMAARRHVADPHVDLDLLSVDIVVPVYNEDPALLAAGLRSVAAQQRLPQRVWVVDDGSTTDGAPLLVLETAEVLDAVAEVRRAGVDVVLHRQANAGKRHAQSVAFARSDADIFVTVDSDTVLHPEAIAKLLIPFSRDDVMSVAGVAYGQNSNRSLLTRTIEVGFVMSFLRGRMAEGAFGAVRVNCGILAAYRGDVVRSNLDRFLGQRFLNRPVRAGDDRMLTLFAKERGRTEFQLEAVSYSALPVALSHLVRQRLRWCRSFCWGTLWLLRRPLRSADFWFTFTQLLALVMYGISMFTGVVGTLTGAISPSLLFSTLAVAATISLASHFRYVLLARPGEPLTQRLLTWWVSPLASVLNMLVLLPLYYVAVTSPRPQRTWGTRSKVEVELFAAGSGDVRAPAVSATVTPTSTPTVPVGGVR